MTEMTAAAAKKLREAFPSKAIGKLPKPYKADSPRGNCKECGGYHGLPAVHLDYVGHAATTDRLLAVDPNWTWEPMATDEQGLPALDRKGNLWIRLTVCGVTRIGVGDGKSAKECIGDAIRNAAMRFGVALDLWAKENLVEFAQAANSHRRATQAAEPPPAPEDDMPITDKTRRELFALFGERGIPDELQLPGINPITGKEYASRKDLTEADAKLVIAHLRKKGGAES